MSFSTFPHPPVRPYRHRLFTEDSAVADRPEGSNWPTAVIDEPASTSTPSSTTQRTSYPRKSRTRPSPAPTVASASGSISTRSLRSRQSQSDGHSQNGLSPDKALQGQDGGMSASSTPPPLPPSSKTYGRTSFSARSDDTLPEESTRHKVLPLDSAVEAAEGNGTSGLSRRTSNGSGTASHPRIKLTFGKKRKVEEVEQEPPVTGKPEPRLVYYEKISSWSGLPPDEMEKAVRSEAAGAYNDMMADLYEELKLKGEHDELDYGQWRRINEHVIPFAKWRRKWEAGWLQVPKHLRASPAPESDEEEAEGLDSEEGLQAGGAEEEDDEEEAPLSSKRGRNDLAEVVIKAQPRRGERYSPKVKSTKSGDVNGDEASGGNDDDVSESGLQAVIHAKDETPLPLDDINADGGHESALKRRRVSVSPPLTEPEEEVEVKQDEAEAAAQKEAQRAPRKKRKWLKKGQVDPDDPAAVARQRERHTMIDQAIENLDRQYAMVEDGTHVQLVEMLDELEKRRDIQLARLDARHKATRDELTFIANHEDRGHMEEWRFRTLAAQDKLSDEIEAKIRLVDVEKTMFKRQPGELTLPRAGLGGGGWMVYDKHLMSKKNLPLVPTFLNGRVRQRRNISIRPCMLDPDSIAEDLKVYDVRQPKQRTYAAEEPAPTSGGGGHGSSHRAAATDMKPPAPPPASGSGHHRDTGRNRAPSTNGPPPSNRDPLPAPPPRNPPPPHDGYRAPRVDRWGRAIPEPQPSSSGHPRHSHSSSSGRPLNGIGGEGFMRPPAVPNPTPFSRPVTTVGGPIPGSRGFMQDPPERPALPSSGASFLDQRRSSVNDNGRLPSDRPPTHAPAGARWGFSTQPPSQSQSQSSHQSSHSSRPMDAFTTRPIPSFGSSTLGRPSTVHKLPTPAPSPYPLPAAGPKSSTVVAGWGGDNRHAWDGGRNPQQGSSAPASNSGPLPPPVTSSQSQNPLPPLPPVNGNSQPVAPLRKSPPPSITPAASYDPLRPPSSATDRPRSSGSGAEASRAAQDAIRAYRDAWPHNR